MTQQTFRKTIFLCFSDYGNPLISHLMEHTYLNLSDLQEYATRLKILMIGNSVISRKLLNQGFLYHKLRETFAKFYNRHFDFIEHFNSSLIKLIEEGISHSHFYGDFLKKIKKINFKTNGVSLQHTVSLITQYFLNRKYNKHILKNTCSLVLSSETTANIHVPILL